MGCHVDNASQNGIRRAMEIQSQAAYLRLGDSNSIGQQAPASNSAADTDDYPTTDGYRIS
jgi:hypothetical protein